MFIYYHNMNIYVDNINNPIYQDEFIQRKVDFNKFHTRQKIVGQHLKAKFLGLSYHEVLNGTPFVNKQHNKPYLKSKKCFFNVSNSYDLVILVTSSHDVGVDIEKKRSFSYKRIARAFNSDELEYLANAKNEYMTLKLWTIKEAVLKQIGVGLSGNPKSVHINLDNLEFAKRNNCIYHLHDLDLFNDYLGTIATKV
ncbi:4'-phosphopantetheinyl transferase family protein [Apilactobacillus xinyiensis]|uniref:4'-phosphopantetheinyl transferase superfamily protein n=2 Tax=Apilactobacillus xinyiensis TaxID=2841032 RepID=A0ABT0I0W8_9LACO|nr:4'-phosphopantetheinyl transferase superfamily protein [Apilactobacillus xinyiensis]MCK8624481.1 4'-phosphopantetheinyl transferase superfamily protein [Apilactobacillus xinyiensis]MCL0318652.1 4'-phosphopantetheinyl transferase superfamily protein [Apilactobacillus xinyiensis]